MPISRKKKAAALSDLIRVVSLHLMQSGMSAQQVRKGLTDGLLAAESDRAVGRVPRPTHFALAKVLHAWHSDPAYVDRQARPRPIPTHGKSLSIWALAEQFGAPLEPAEIAALLGRHRLIKRISRGKFLPTDSVLWLRTPNSVQTGYLGRAIFNLLSTNQANMTVDGAGAGLLERAALVGALPRRHLKDFRAFSSQQGANFVSNINDWLEARSGNHRRGRRTSGLSVGVHAFAFVEPD